MFKRLLTVLTSRHSLARERKLRLLFSTVSCLHLIITTLHIVLLASTFLTPIISIDIRKPHFPRYEDLDGLDSIVQVLMEFDALVGGRQVVGIVVLAKAKVVELLMGSCLWD